MGQCLGGIRVAKKQVATVAETRVGPLWVVIVDFLTLRSFLFSGRGISPTFSPTQRLVSISQTVTSFIIIQKNVSQVKKHVLSTVHSLYKTIEQC